MKFLQHLFLIVFMYAVLHGTVYAHVHAGMNASYNGKYIGWLELSDYSSVEKLMKRLEIGPYYRKGINK